MDTPVTHERIVYTFGTAIKCAAVVQVKGCVDDEHISLRGSDGQQYGQRACQIKHKI